MFNDTFYRVRLELVFRTGNMLPSFTKGLQHFILVYHGVSKHDNKLFNSRHEPVSIFEKHIRFLKRHFHIIPLTDFFEQHFLPGKINVAITFDDGYKNNFICAKPVLEKYNAPATIFVTGMNQTGASILWADFLNIVTVHYNEPVIIDGETFRKEGDSYVSGDTGKSLYEVIKNDRPDYRYKELMFEAFRSMHGILQDKSINDYWELMTDEQIIACSKSKLIEIGSHGFYHNNLGNLPLQIASEELTKSKNYLENLVQTPVISLAYPDSSYNAELVNAAKGIGFKYQLAASGLKYEMARQDARLHDRVGIYNCGQPGTQLLIPIKSHFN